MKFREKKYLLNFIDHFSKYASAYIIDNKKADTILSILKILFSKISFPETLGTDNGSEFTNKKFRKYLEDNNVKLIHGKAYNSRSQGCIERLHRTIKIGLICKKLELGSEFNLELSLDKILFNYNNTVFSAIVYKI